MRLFSFATAALVLLAPALTGCDDDPTDSAARYDLTFSGDETFQGAHGDQPVAVVVTEQTTGAVVAADADVVSAQADPTFSFSFSNVLVEGVSYYLDYWIDSNFGGGELGTCDPPANDHQWRMEIGPVTGDVTQSDTHRPTETESVCASFE